MPYKSKKDKKKYSAAYYAKNRDVMRQKMKEYSIKSRYGLTPKMYKALFIEQNFRCKLCPAIIEPYKPNSHVDHVPGTGMGANHTRTGIPAIVRGILCAGCNTSLGRIEHKGEEWIKRAITHMQCRSCVSGEAESAR